MPLSVKCALCVFQFVFYLKKGMMLYRESLVSFFNIHPNHEKCDFIFQKVGFANGT